MKKMISIVLTVVILCTVCCAFPVSAVPAPVSYLVGDMNNDGSLTVGDATIVQQAVAEIFDLSEFNHNVADFNHDGFVTISDATLIQMKSAEMEVPEGCGGYIDCNIRIYDFYADYISDSAVKGTAVTFTANTYDYCDNTTYAFYINNELVQARSESNKFTYTFPDSGLYNVAVYAFNKYGYSTMHSEPYYVLDSVDNSVPRITQSRQESDWTDAYLYLNAEGGTAPYKYSVKIQVDKCYYDSELTAFIQEYYKYYKSEHPDLEWQLLYDDDNYAYFYRDFSSDTTVVLDELVTSFEGCLVTVQAKDAKGVLSEPRVTYSTWDLIG